MMFSTKERLIQRTGRNNVDRPTFLKQLVAELKTTKSQDQREQVLANLANFAYDPINYEYLRDLAVIPLFLEELSSPSSQAVQFAIGGLCNLCLDFENKKIINEYPGGISAIQSCLNSTDLETQLSAITTLIYLITPQSRKEILKEETVELMVALSKNPNKRIQNLALVFLEDSCDERSRVGAEQRVGHALSRQPSVASGQTISDSSTPDHRR